MSSRTVSSAFEKELCRLCLQDFPCGQGSWSKPREQGCKEDSWGYLGKEMEGTEEQEDMIELLNGPISPWQQEAETWSPQAAALRVLSITSAARLSDNFICEYFTTLRLVDKQISVIDKGALKFTRLEELVLTANHISQLPSSHLPRSLRVLEVCANQVSSLQSLCQPPPPRLQHLGLAFNRLGSTSDARLLTAPYWPQLVSLDLSWSGFVEQLVLVDSLATLPHLRTLALEGNPLTLAPSYPGFFLDSLPRLLYLDGGRVTADDRHRFHGLAKRRDAVIDEAVVTVTVHRMRGVPDPSLASDSSAAEFPLVTYSFLVTYKFWSPLPMENKAGSGEGQDETPLEALQNWGEETCHTFPYPGPSAVPGDGGLSQCCSCPVIENSTPKLPWAEPIEYNHASVYHIRDLASLKRCFLRGLNITVEEEKYSSEASHDIIVKCPYQMFFLGGVTGQVLSWPASPGENMENKPLIDKRGTAKESVRPTSNTCSSQKTKDKKRKKESLVELVQDPPIRRTLGSAHLELRDLASGENQVYRLCDFGVPTEPRDRTSHDKILKDVNLSPWRASDSADTEPNKKVKEDKKKEDKRAKPAGENVAAQRTTPSKGKNKGKKDREAEGSETFQNFPEPLILEISIQLDKWTWTDKQTDKATTCQDLAPLRR